MHRARLLVLVIAAGCSSKVDDDVTTDARADATDAPADSGSLDAPTDTFSPADTGDYASCSGPGSCYVVPKLRTDVCCPTTCGVLGKGDSAAIARGKYASYSQATCGGTMDVCDACIAQVSPTLFGACVSGSCTLQELSDPTFSTCAGDSDCELRFPGCCESCGGDAAMLVAVAKGKHGAYLAEVCDPAAGACPPCVPAYPSGYTAVCDATSKRCKVQAP